MSESDSIPAENHEVPAGTVLPDGWQPEGKVIASLKEEGVEPAWLESHLESFCLDCRRSGERSFAWSAKFFKSAKREWLRVRSMDPMVRKTFLPEDWNPGERARAALHQSGVPLWWALTLTAEFKLYWLERREKRNHWDLVFYHRCHQVWMQLTADQRLAITNGKLPTVGKNADQDSGNKRTRDMSIEEIISDTSWGDDPWRPGRGMFDSLSGDSSGDTFQNGEW